MRSTPKGAYGSGTTTGTPSFLQDLATLGGSSGAAGGINALGYAGSSLGSTIGNIGSFIPFMGARGGRIGKKGATPFYVDYLTKELATGAGAPFKKAVGQWADEFGIKLPKPWDTAGYQEFIKDAYLNVVATAKTANEGTGSRLLATELNQLENAANNIELTPAANKHLINQGLGQVEWSLDQTKDYNQWYEYHGAQGVWRPGAFNSTRSMTISDRRTWGCRRLPSGSTVKLSKCI
jgi:hypothetical protein